MTTIAQLNDIYRQQIPYNHCFVTRGIMALLANELNSVFEGVRTFNTFTPDNDPYGEHDFGAFYINNHRLFWKINYYSSEVLETGAQDPGSPETVRALTIMLADEW